MTQTGKIGEIRKRLEALSKKSNDAKERALLMKQPDIVVAGLTVRQGTLDLAVKVIDDVLAG